MSLLMAAGAAVIHAAADVESTADQWGLPGFEGILAVVTASVGYLITRRTSNPTGWIFTAMGIGSGAQYLAEQYSTIGLQSDPVLPAAVTVAWIAEWIWVPLVAAVALLLLVFPDDRIESRPGRLIAAAIALAGSSAFFAAAFLGPRVMTWDVENPYAINDNESLFNGVFSVAAMALMLTLVAAAARLVSRLRRASGIRRQQLKWFVYAAAFASISMVFSAIPATTGVGSKFAVVGIVFIAVASAIAVLRYRLYDIDVVINRTLVYATLTVVLASAYVILVFTLQALLSPLTKQSDIAVGGSTLAVAALFRPVRSRVQQFIDRRFNRERYDSRVMLDLLNHRVRDAVALETVETLVLDVVNKTVAPSAVALWLREQ